MIDPELRKRLKKAVQTAVANAKENEVEITLDSTEEFAEDIVQYDADVEKLVTDNDLELEDVEDVLTEVLEEKEV